MTYIVVPLWVTGPKFFPKVQGPRFLSRLALSSCSELMPPAPPSQAWAKPPCFQFPDVTNQGSVYKRPVSILESIEGNYNRMELVEGYQLNTGHGQLLRSIIENPLTKPLLLVVIPLGPWVTSPFSFISKSFSLSFFSPDELHSYPIIQKATRDISCSQIEIISTQLHIYWKLLKKRSLPLKIKIYNFCFKNSTAFCPSTSLTPWEWYF